MGKHGRPDWYNITPMIQVHASEDINELAARLGAPVTVDRRGNVIAFEDFGGGKGAWGFNASDAGSTINWVAHEGLYRSLAIQLHTLTPAASYSLATRRFPFPLSGSVGVEWGFAHSITPTSVGWYLTVYDGTYQHNYWLEYTYATGVMAYWNGTSYTPLYTDTKVFATSDLVTNFVKFAVDVENGMFLRLITGDRSDSMASIPGVLLANVQAREVQVSFYVFAHNTIVTDSFIEWVTLTINEL